ncbi:MAG: hypothetical protein NTZ85_07005 [Bacteroidia bacterium]|jgi:hypothetical protein|nr:hypothetical protein [Bacteroidia bacterium]
MDYSLLLKAPLFKRLSFEEIEDIPAPGALASAFMFGNRNRFPVNVITILQLSFRKALPVM